VGYADEYRGPKYSHDIGGVYLMGKARRYNTYDQEVDFNRKQIETYGLERQKKSIGSSFRTVPLPRVPQPGGGGSGGSGAIQDPIIVNENDLGTITTATNINWAAANFHRCIAGADIQFTMTGLPPAGKYQTVVLEIKQDGTGNRAITFADAFLNSHVPTINLAANGVTTIAFYTYDDGTDRILGFNTFQNNSIITALSDETSALQATSTTVPIITFRMPYALTLTAVRSSLTNNGGGSPLTTLDIKESGTTILSTALSIDGSGELTSTTAATPAVISDTVLADDAEITVFLTNKNAGATGLKLYLIGYLA